MFMFQALTFFCNSAHVCGPGVRQYCINADGACCTHSYDWASPEMLEDIKKQQKDAAPCASSLRDQLAPAWEHQQIFVAIPTKEDRPTMEWRLCSRVISFGELMLALGEEYSAHDIDLFWKSMIIAAEKRLVKDHRSRNR